jgi:hypothetical protein
MTQYLGQYRLNAEVSLIQIILSKGTEDPLNESTWISEYAVQIKLSRISTDCSAPGQHLAAISALNQQNYRSK